MASGLPVLALGTACLNDTAVFKRKKFRLADDHGVLAFSLHSWPILCSGSLQFLYVM